MAAIEFDARITDGRIEIPAAHQGLLTGDVHVVVYQQSVSESWSKIDELIRRPIAIADFQPLSREEAHGRD